MSIEIRLPKLAESMTSATVAAWLKQPGEQVTAGDPVAEIETDKTTVELESPEDGVLDEICVAAGTERVAVGTVIALLRDRGDAGDISMLGDAPDKSPVLTEVRLPELAESMTSATVTAWLKQPGERVTVGDAIAEIETDKTTVELESPVGGVLNEICIAAGTQEVAVDTVLATIRRGTEDAGMLSTSNAPVGSVASGPIRSSATASPPKKRALQEQGFPTAVAEARMSSVDVSATSLARRMASLAGVDLGSVRGSGDGGRVTKNDVEKQLGTLLPSLEVPGRPSDILSVPPATALPSDSAYTDESLTAVRRVTAERMAMAKRTIPHFYLEIECSVDQLLALQDLKNTASSVDNLTVNDFVVRAAALALIKVPRANSAWIGNAVRVFDSVNVAVAVTTASGLVTPVIRSADTKDLRAIARELRELVGKARDGRLRPADYGGGTCTISNLGMYGVSSLYAILNPPQSCILGVGSIEPRPIVRDGVVNVGSMMTVTLSADHRAIDGVTGAELLRALKHYIEDPRQVFE